MTFLTLCLETSQPLYYNSSSSIRVKEELCIGLIQKNSIEFLVQSHLSYIC